MFTSRPCLNRSVTIITSKLAPLNITMFIATKADISIIPIDDLHTKQLLIKLVNDWIKYARLDFDSVISYDVICEVEIDWPTDNLFDVIHHEAVYKQFIQDQSKPSRTCDEDHDALFDVDSDIMMRVFNLEHASQIIFGFEVADNIELKID